MNDGELSGEQLAYGLTAAAKVSGLSRRCLENYIRYGLLKSRKIGKRRLILRNDLLHFLKRDQISASALKTEETR